MTGIPAVGCFGSDIETAAGTPLNPMARSVDPRARTFAVAEPWASRFPVPFSRSKSKTVTSSRPTGTSAVITHVLVQFATALAIVPPPTGRTRIVADFVEGETYDGRAFGAAGGDAAWRRGTFTVTVKAPTLESVGGGGTAGFWPEPEHAESRARASAKLANRQTTEGVTRKDSTWCR